MAEKKYVTLTVLGSTGSVGRQVLAAVDRHPDRFKVVGLSAFTNERLLREQIDKYSPKHYYYPAGGVEIQSSLFDFLDDEKFASKCVGSLEELADHPADITVSAVSGIAGLWAAVAVLKRGGTLAIANKETIVCAGRHLKALEKKYGGRILPLDTEHSAIWECLKGEDGKYVKNIILTASGGALRDMPTEKLAKVTAREALNHPVWNMGKKVTIDSATLFNKGLEVIEAMRLFGMSADNVKVLMHRESVIHGMAEKSVAQRPRYGARDRDRALLSRKSQGIGARPRPCKDRESGIRRARSSKVSLPGRRHARGESGGGSVHRGVRRRRGGGGGFPRGDDRFFGHRRRFEKGGEEIFDGGRRRSRGYHRYRRGGSEIHLFHRSEMK